MRMSKGFPLGLVLASLLPILGAEPGNGFGLSVGGVSARQGGLTSAGLSLGGDAQFVLNDRWSLNPFLMVSLERSSAPRQNLSDNLGGIQFRRWWREVYFGPQLFFHDRLIYGGGSVSSSQYGPGLGLVLGWEGQGGGSAGVQVDALEGQFLATADRRTAVRAYVGYRFSK